MNLFSFQPHSEGRRGGNGASVLHSQPEAELGAVKAAWGSYNHMKSQGRAWLLFLKTNSVGRGAKIMCYFINLPGDSGREGRSYNRGAPLTAGTGYRAPSPSVSRSFLIHDSHLLPTPQKLRYCHHRHFLVTPKI